MQLPDNSAIVMIYSTTAVLHWQHRPEPKASWVSQLPPPQLEPATADEQIFSLLPSLLTLAWLTAWSIIHLDNGNFPAQPWRAEEFWPHWFGWLACQAVKGCISPSLCAPFLSITKGSVGSRAAVKRSHRRWPQP